MSPLTPAFFVLSFSLSFFFFFIAPVPPAANSEYYKLLMCNGLEERKDAMVCSLERLESITSEHTLKNTVRPFCNEAASVHVKIFTILVNSQIWQPVPAHVSLQCQHLVRRKASYPLSRLGFFFFFIMTLFFSIFWKVIRLNFSTEMNKSEYFVCKSNIFNVK